MSLEFFSSPKFVIFSNLRETMEKLDIKEVRVVKDPR